jgi:hypothetical protein
MGSFIAQCGNLTGKINAEGTLSANIRPRETLSAIVSKAKTDTEKVYIFKDESGVEVYGVLSSNETVLTATAEDIRKGKTAVTEEGIVVGKGEF